MKSFKGATVLVTGASSGIGEAFARNLANRGANLILTARSEDRLHQIAMELSEKHAIQAHVFSGDLSLPDTPQRLWGEVQSASLSVDVLINNAGFGKCGALPRVRLSELSRYAESQHQRIGRFNASLPARDVEERGRGGYQRCVNSGVPANPLPRHLQCHESICPRLLRITLGGVSRTWLDGARALSRQHFHQFR